MTPIKAVDYLSSNEYDWKVSRYNFHSLGVSSQCDETFALLGSLLSDFNNYKNPRISLALKWLRDRRALPILVKLIKDKRTEGYRSTLIYATSDFNPIEYIEIFVELLISGSYDIVRECANVIDNLEGDIEDEVLNQCIDKLTLALDECSDCDKKNIILYILSLFDENIECDFDSSIYEYDERIVNRINKRRNKE